MNKSQAKKRIEKLKKLINHHRYLYHVLDKQEISDSALDSLKKELFDLEQEYPEFIAPDSPTQKIGGAPLKKFKKIKHSQPMLSFNDAFSKEDMKNWEKRIKKLLTIQEAENLNYFCELKFDGLAIELVYKNKILQTGATRGNGIIGENVTQNIKTINSIPLRLRDNSLEKRVIVRGEAIIFKKEFLKINKLREKAGLSVYSNPRNITAGSIRQLDPKITYQRNLDFFGYDLISDLEQIGHEQEHRILKEIGFKVNPHIKFCNNLEEVFQFYKKWEAKRRNLEYEIDGIVVVVNNNEIFNKLGAIGKSPRGAVAYKFPLKQAETIVKDIKVQVGRTGAVTPVAYLKPIKVGGVIISRATLHNEDEIKRLGIKIKDTVIIGRAGDVIPMVVKVLKELRTGKEIEFDMPKLCPYCRVKLVRRKEEVIWRCPNSKCESRQKRYLSYFVSRQGFNIEGLGPKIIEQLFEKKFISDPADIFNLQEKDILTLEGFAQKAVNNLIESIETKKEISFSKFIYALGIDQVGEETAQDLANYFKNLEEIKKTRLEELIGLKDIGPETAESIYNWFQQEHNIKILEKLKQFGVKIKYELPIRGLADKNKILLGKVFVLTGSLDKLNRAKAKEKIKELGGKVLERINKNTNFLILGKNPGSKFEKAKKLNIKIISEKEFLSLITID
ncbi:NAD-dependent DNA ligase LigA [Candidatus Atribacteria bacterium MT.SAG.1]|nr:NAD-dependent DNA ligase LigA [Candidatus Atribacteria bacterium MT.SAG.1]